MLSYEEYVKQNFPDYYEKVFCQVPKKTAIELLRELYEDNYFCPVCGNKMIFCEEVRCFGHGDFWPVVWLKCDCGISLKEFCILQQRDIDEFLLFIEKFKC